MHVQLYAQGFLLINISVCIYACCAQTSVCRTRLPSTSFAPTVRLAPALQCHITYPLPPVFLLCCVFNNMLHRDQDTHLQVQGRMDREFLSPKMPEQAVGRRVLLRQQTFTLLPGVTVYQRQTRRVLHRQRDRRPNLLSDGTLHQQAECRRVLLRKWIQCRT